MRCAWCGIETDRRYLVDAKRGRKKNPVVISLCDDHKESAGPDIEPVLEEIK